ncbi:MAG TPA: VTT domain-containing protein, partial [Mycobacterium sp.]
DARFRQRGWAIVLSLRLIPAVPFSVINYAAGASAVRVSPYTVATFVGLIPGTLAFVVLGDAVTGRVNPLLVVVSAVFACVGVTGLVYEIRSHGPAASLPPAPSPSSPRTWPETPLPEPH